MITGRKLLALTGGRVHTSHAFLIASVIEVQQTGKTVHGTTVDAIVHGEVRSIRWVTLPPT
jgi:hypothetical protein